MSCGRNIPALATRVERLTVPELVEAGRISFPSESLEVSTVAPEFLLLGF
jgi:hypothetical protein